MVPFLIGYIGTVRVLLVARTWMRRDDCCHRGSTHDSRGELVGLPLVGGSARCNANGPGSIIDGLGRVPGADVG